MAFNVSNTLGRQGGRVLTDPYEHRPTGRGGPDDSDITQGRLSVEADVVPKPQPWQPKPLNEDQIRNNLQVIPVQYRPEVVLRFSDQKTLLLSGLLDKAGPIAERAIVVNAHLGSGTFCCLRIILCIAERRSGVTTWCSMRSSTTTICGSRSRRSNTDARVDVSRGAPALSIRVRLVPDRP